MTTLGDASIYAPNTYFTDFTARKLSNPRFRGIGSSPANPAITTYIDGVPQLNTNSSSIEFLDVSQVEFVRGPQSALFGRNTLGGLVNVSSARPSLTKWTGSALVPFGNFSAVDVRANASGPIGSQGGGRVRDRPLAARRVHQERRHRPRRRLPGRHVRQGAAAAHAGRQLGSALHLQRRARPRRRLRARTISPRSAPTRSTPRATSKGTPIATSTRRPSSRDTPGTSSRSRRRPASSTGRPTISPISTTRRCR